MQKIWFAFLTLFMLSLPNLKSALAVPRMAQNPQVDCTKAVTTPELRYCAGLSLEETNNQLDRLYQQALSGVSGAQREELVQSRAAWMEFRDRYCNFETYASRDGTGYPIFLSSCLERLAKQRIADLQEYLAPRSQNTTSPSVVRDRPSISSLPNGNYRYVTADLPNRIVSDEELVQTGGYYFLFRKNGDRISGLLNQIDSENSICISGLISGNTLTGQAVEVSEPPQDVARLLTSGDGFVTWDMAGNLKVRRGLQRGNIIRYRSAILNLNDFNRINAGTQVPPTACP